jgi:hypothetical protein
MTCLRTDHGRSLSGVLLVQHIRDVTDPEHPYTLEQLKVVSENDIAVQDDEGLVRCELLLSAARMGSVHDNLSHAGCNGASRHSVVDMQSMTPVASGLDSF